jgi:hypothetical protein
MLVQSSVAIPAPAIVFPAKAGIQTLPSALGPVWAPAFAGVTVSA